MQLGLWVKQLYHLLLRDTHQRGETVQVSNPALTQTYSDMGQW